jgi:hypothetical protein
MARIIQIRVAAETANRDDMRKAWPRLVHYAWPAKIGKPEVRGGVLDLVEILHDRAQFDAKAGWLTDAKAEVEALADTKADMERALADWDPKGADKLAWKIEDGLDELEKIAPKP